MVTLTFRLQKKNSRRYSVYLGDEYLFSVSSAVYQKLAASGGTLCVESVEAFQKECLYWEQYHSCLALLARRAYASAELRQKLAARQCPPKIIEAVLKKLTEEHLLCDEAYREQFIRSRQTYGKQGFYRIRRELLQRGISLSEEEYDREAELLNLKTLVEKLLSLQTDPKAIIRRLERKGYRLSDIISCIKACSAKEDLEYEVTDYD